ncbi:MAG TPA: Fe-S cluster assembly protein SufD [Vicinamibacterales bacterium]|nr:Fe-S cluster assembly protein SufD [Vicinamibacterales bacterium]
MAPVVVSPAEASRERSGFLLEYERFNAGAGSSQPAWLRELRGRAMARFAELGIPTTRDEEWRFTNVAPIGETTFRLGSADVNGAAAALLESVQGVDAHRLVLVNGRYAPEWSSPDSPAGVEVASLAEALDRAPAALQPVIGRLASFDHRAFVALNTAFLQDGLFIRVRPGTIVERPLHIVFVSVSSSPEAFMSHPRVLALVGASSQVRIVESYVGSEGPTYFTNAVGEFEIGENAVVDYYKDQRESAGAFHVALQVVRCARSATFLSHAFTLGGQIVRNDAVALLDGEGVDCTLNGLYLSDGQRLVDTHTTIDHAKPHCGSHELYKGILAGRSRAIFNGKIIVRPDAQKTDAKQTNRALLLSDEAQINTKPQLEIFADDVKCTHGAAIGQLDEEALFYLRARGLSAQQARDMLIHAFAGDILNRVKIESLRDQLEAELFAQLRRDGVM